MAQLREEGIVEKINSFLVNFFQSEEVICVPKKGFNGKKFKVDFMAKLFSFL